MKPLLLVFFGVVEALAQSPKVLIVKAYPNDENITTYVRRAVFQQCFGFLQN